MDYALKERIGKPELFTVRKGAGHDCPILTFDQVLITRNAKHYPDDRLKLLVPDYILKDTKEVEDVEEK